MLARRPSRLVPAPLVKPGRPKPDHSLFSPLERNPLSPKGWKKREADGVGLGFVASLDRARQTAVCGPADLGDFPVADFLSCCNLCKKRLHGKDIYMYRGETAFCSKECREQQILSDERTEKCSSRAAMMPPEISASPCSGGARKLFFAGITAA